MQQEMVTLRQEVQSLRREVRGQRGKQRRSLMIAVVAVLIAAVSPVAAFAANPFNDLVGGSPHNGNIDLIYNAGITTGCDPNRSYCPTDLVTRQEMASFLARTAGLGSNQPIVNAKTAVQANTANTATTATTAQSANTLNGFAANGLVRVNGASQGDNPLFVTTSYNSYATVSLAAPGPGFVYLTGAVTVYATSASNAFVSAAILDEATGFGSYEQSAVVGTTSGTTFSAVISPTIILPVSAGGTRTYHLIVGKDPASTGTTGANAATLSAIFVPFGPSGATGSEVSLPTKPIGNPPSRP